MSETGITLYGSHDDYDNGSIAFTRHFRVLKNAICEAAQNDEIDRVVFKRGDYVYSFENDLIMLRIAYKSRGDATKPLWDLWMKRLDAIERCEYP